MTKPKIYGWIVATNLNIKMCAIVHQNTSHYCI